MVIYLGIFSDYFLFLISFMFTFALVYGILIISNVFKGQKRVNILISISIALFASLYENYVSFLFQWMSYIVIFFIIVFLLSILRNLFEGKAIKENWETLITIVILFLIFLSIYPYFQISLGNYVNSQDILLTIGLVFIILILAIGSKV